MVLMRERIGKLLEYLQEQILSQILRDSGLQNEEDGGYVHGS